ncbi:lysine N(6)-hydroxylase/L-ornithine N(5)-oxygenase family protein [Gracilibacillus oryzae]|uniref:Lysine N(6)-hydroxylase/L-ornithine N(5)-oxygenase family protein n=1 Tax=Gracilibacillus oryzae TaxID=1672701 RepID=A0A7C8KQ42_9BACI|nr:FAD/NAD(P)-binding protein [Gracilibacillus oryzae]KAB8126640.1 lysine N(6)-hydroxylase/L-ornithine N(5)-oxygenase family protein [Gracilibacillus oryzae]
MYKWIIIGGGIQGCCVATRLLQNKVSKEELLIIDPHPEPIWMWRTLTDRIGMAYLRSPSVHHIAADPYSLKKYSRSNDYAKAFKGNYSRPRLDMFNQHSLDEIDKAGVHYCWKQGTVNGLSWSKNDWKVRMSGNQVVKGERVVLALGVNQEPHYPDWVSEYKASDAVSHIFDLDKPLPDQGDVIILGGGMTAGHLANTLSKQETINSVHLVKRHSIRIHKFDSDPGWLGPKYLTKYYQTDCYKKRRSLIQQARNRGSMTRDLYLELNRQSVQGRLNLYTGEIEEAKLIDGMIELMMNNGEIVRGHSLILATGAELAFPGKEWIQPVIDQLALPCAPCGFPIVSRSLEWKAGLFVAGALAELEIGPVSRNIAGARKAAERIAQNA